MKCRKMNKPGKEEQIRALIEHRAYDLVRRYAGAGALDGKAYQDIFSITKKDLLTFLQENHHIHDIIPQRKSKSDGFYAIPTKKGYETYEQYDNHKTKSKELTNPQDVWSEYVDYLIRTSGTGLTF
jgi:hypothetical protein